MNGHIGKQIPVRRSEKLSPVIKSQTLFKLLHHKQGIDIFPGMNTGVHQNMLCGIFPSHGQGIEIPAVRRRSCYIHPQQSRISGLELTNILFHLFICIQSVICHNGIGLSQKPHIRIALHLCPRHPYPGSKVHGTFQNLYLRLISQYGNRDTR